jgi:hypothetical protein
MNLMYLIKNLEVTSLNSRTLSVEANLNQKIMVLTYQLMDTIRVMSANMIKTVLYLSSVRFCLF